MTKNLEVFMDKLNIVEIKSLHERTITKEQFQLLQLNENVEYVEEYSTNDYFIDTIDGDYFEVFIRE